MGRRRVTCDGEVLGTLKRGDALVDAAADVGQGVDVAAAFRMPKARRPGAVDDGWRMRRAGGGAQWQRPWDGIKRCRMPSTAVMRVCKKSPSSEGGRGRITKRNFVEVVNDRNARLWAAENKTKWMYLRHPLGCVGTGRQCLNRSLSC